MYCTNCGHELPEGAKFCGECGYPVAEDILQKFRQQAADSHPESELKAGPTPQPEPELQTEPAPQSETQVHQDASEYEQQTQYTSQPQPASQADGGGTNTTSPVGGSPLSGDTADTILKIASIVAAVVFAYFTVRGIGSVFSSILSVFISGHMIASLFTFLGSALNFVSAALMTAALLLFAFFRTDENTENAYLTVAAAAVARVLAGALSMIFTYFAREIRHLSINASPFTSFIVVLIWAVIAAGVIYALLYLSGNKLFIGKTTDELKEMLQNLPAFLTEEFGVVSEKVNSYEKQKTAEAGTTSESSYAPYKMKTDRNFFLVLLLTICTCGIYGLYYYYKMAKDLNTICDGDGKKTGGLLFRIVMSLCTCGIYEFYWEYSYANRMWNNASRYGIQIKETGTTILLWDILGMLCCGIGSLIVLYLQIKNLNALSRAYNIAMFGEP